MGDAARPDMQLAADIAARAGSSRSTSTPESEQSRSSAPAAHSRQHCADRDSQLSGIEAKLRDTRTVVEAQLVEFASRFEGVDSLCKEMEERIKRVESKQQQQQQPQH